MNRKLLAMPIMLLAFAAQAQTPVPSQQEAKPEKTKQQQVEDQSTEQSATGKKLPAVVVAGERRGSFKSNTIQLGTFRDMAPLDVPQTSNVITREVMDAQATTSLFGALQNTAGVTRSQLNGSTYDNIAIRGILVENRSNYRLNGALPIINLIDIPMENKERVEVLKEVLIKSRI